MQVTGVDMNNNYVGAGRCIGCAIVYRGSALVIYVATRGMHSNDVLAAPQTLLSINIKTCYTRYWDVTLAAGTQIAIVLRITAQNGLSSSKSPVHLYLNPCITSTNTWR